MIIIVGDRPSKKNIDPAVPFVGTKSYATLLSWIGTLDISINDTCICNTEHIKLDYDGNPYLEIISPHMHWSFNLAEIDDRVIALGKSAEKELKSMNVEHFALPHPSGLNRKLNDKTWLNGELKKCKNWLE